MLRDLKERSPRLAVGDGALGFRSALEQVYPETTQQRCRFHKLGNVLAALPKSRQGKAKSDLQAIWMAPTRKGAEQAFARLLRLRGRALGTLAHHQPDRAHVRRRTTRTKHCVSRSTFLGLAFKLAEEAAKSWPRIRAPQTLAELLAGTRYEDAIPVTDDPPEQQREAA